MGSSTGWRTKRARRGKTIRWSSAELKIPFVPSYYRCFRSKSMKCPGKFLMENGKIRNFHAHSHEKETKISIVDKFRKVLTKKAVEKPTKSLVEIYLEETLNFTEASILYPFQSAESTMRKARTKHKPRVNKLAEGASEPDQQLLSANHQLQKHYCQEVLQPHGTTVIFMHQHSVKLLGKIEEIHVDCTITCKSDDQSEDLHLLTVLAIMKSQDYPIAFGLVKLKSVEVLSSFLIYIRDKAPAAMTPNNILTSCDVNLQEALRISFPDATVKILWFFYASSVVKFAKENGMLAMMNKSLFHLSSLKMMLAIPLIPANYMLPGLDSLKKWMSEKSVVNYDGLCEYIDATWLVSDGAEKISIFNGLSHSINNYVQNFNRDLLHTVNVDSLTKEQLLELISKQASRTIMKLNRSNGTPTLKKAQKLQKTILETATHNWIKANIHLRRPIQFLQQVSHCIDDGMINFLVNHDVDDKRSQSFATPSLHLSFPDPGSSSEPPPLIFYHKPTTTTIVRQILPSSEPPPLVPIVRRQTQSNSNPIS